MTDTQRVLYDYITQFVSRHGEPPLIKVAASDLSKAMSTLSKQAKILRRDGWLVASGRTLGVPARTCPHCGREMVVAAKGVPDGGS